MMEMVGWIILAIVAGMAAYQRSGCISLLFRPWGGEMSECIIRWGAKWRESYERQNQY